MFDFIKKKFKKNASGSDSGFGADVFAVDVDKYMKSVEGGILPYWVDRELVEKIGVNDIFTNGAHVKNTRMTYDEAFDCLKRVCKMTEMATYVIEEFCERSKKLPRENMRAVDDSNFYSANTLRDLFIEAGKQDFVYDDEVPEDVEDAIDLINANLECFSVVKKNVFFVTVNEAKVSLNKMKGFV